jgi:hypothetical protein
LEAVVAVERVNHSPAVMVVAVVERVSSLRSQVLQ